MVVEITVPAVVEAVKAETGKKTNKSVNPDEVVPWVLRSGSVITGDVKDVVLLDVTPLSLNLSKQWVESSQNSSTVTPLFI